MPAAGKRRLVELRVPSGGGEAADVHERAGARLLEAGTSSASGRVPWPIVKTVPAMVATIVARRRAPLRLLPSEPVSVRLDELLRQAFPDAREVSVVDRTGGGDHFHVTVVTPRFAELSLVEQHRLVYDALADPMADGTIHELRITTRGAP